MAIINLKDAVKCLGLTGISNFKLRDTVNTIIGRAKVVTSSLIASTRAGITAQAQSQFNTLLSTAQAELDAATAIYDSAYNTASSIMTTIRNFDGQFVITCPNATNAKVLEPIINIIADIKSLPSSNDTDTNTTNPDVENKKEEEKSKNIGLAAMVKHITKVDTELSNKGPLEVREHVRQLKHVHPNLAPYIENLKFFQPITDYIGSSYLAYTPDKSSIQLEDWSNTTIGSNFTPTAIRKNLNNKIRPELVSTIENTYIALNTALVSNISKEFINERAPGSNMAHAYHLAGDYIYNRDHMNLNTTSAAATVGLLFNAELGEQVQQVDYYYPITENITVDHDTYTIEEEPNLPPIKVDKRKNLAISAFTVVNNDALTPTPPAES